MKDLDLQTKILVWWILILSLVVAILLFADTLECMWKDVSELDWYCIYLLNK